MRDHLLLHVNGVRHQIRGSAVFQTLAHFLRETLHATGTKIVCEEGDCGACTVLVGRLEGEQLEYRAVNSCIQFLFQLDCTHIVSVEGLGTSAKLTPLQDSMVTCHGAQCGYCTPGFIMAMAGLFERTDSPTAQDAREAVTGNLCRCTGYDPIVNATLAVKRQPRVDALFPPEPIVRAIRGAIGEAVELEGLARPVSLVGALRYRAEHPEAVIVQGATDYGVWYTKRGFRAPAILSLDGLNELQEIELEERTVAVGGRVTLAAFEQTMRELVPALVPIMDRFGSPQIKNAGTLAGNIANASPIADSLPFLFVSDAELEMVSLNGSRRVPIGAFYLGYKKLDLRPDEIIARIRIPLPAGDDLLGLYKISKRSHLDISSFTAAVRVQREGDHIASARVAFGGVGPVVLRLPKCEEALTGRPFALETFRHAGAIAREEVAPISDVRGSRDYRLQLAENILCRFFHESSGGSGANVRESIEAGAR